MSRCAGERERRERKRERERERGKREREREREREGEREYTGSGVIAGMQSCPDSFLNFVPGSAPINLVSLGTIRFLPHHNPLQLRPRYLGVHGDLTNYISYAPRLSPSQRIKLPTVRGYETNKSTAFNERKSRQD